MFRPKNLRPSFDRYPAIKRALSTAVPLGLLSLEPEATAIAARPRTQQGRSNSVAECSSVHQNGHSARTPESQAICKARPRTCRLWVRPGDLRTGDGQECEPATAVLNGCCSTGHTGTWTLDLAVPVSERPAVRFKPLCRQWLLNVTFNNSTFCPHSVFVFCVDLRTNSDYFPIQH